jgi:hypothetical protein
MRNHPETALLFVVLILSAAIVAIAFAVAPWSDRFLYEKEDFIRARSSPAAVVPFAELAPRQSPERDRGP